MLPRADLTPTRPPASLEAATTVVSSTDTRVEIFSRLNQIAIGRELQATVDKMLDDGTYLVKVADTAARMALPVGTKVGDTLSMVFIAKEPRPTFLLTQQQGSAQASLSTTARLIDHIVHTAEQEGMPAAVPGKTPLASTPAELQPRQLAASLQNAVGRSGLFYESHLHEWISGTRSPAELAREPQAQLSRTWQAPAAGTAGQDALRADFARLAATVGTGGEGAQKLTELIRDGRLPVMTHAAADALLVAQPEARLPAVDPEAARLINLQLNALEHQSVQWRGELHPGMPLEWEIHEDTQQQGGAREEPQQQAWTSTVRFELPHLGGISATIRLVGDRVHVQVDTETEDTASTLRHFGGMLSDALEGAGAPLDSLTVKRHGPP